MKFYLEGSCIWLRMQIYPDQNGFELEHQKKKKQKQAPTIYSIYSPHKCFIKTNVPHVNSIRRERKMW